MPTWLLEGRRLILILTITGLLAACTKAKPPEPETQSTPESARCAAPQLGNQTPDPTQYVPMKQYASLYDHYKMQKDRADRLTSDLETCRQVNTDQQEDVRRWQNMYYGFSCEPYESSNED